MQSNESEQSPWPRTFAYRYSARWLAVVFAFFFVSFLSGFFSAVPPERVADAIMQLSLLELVLPVVGVIGAIVAVIWLYKRIFSVTIVVFPDRIIIPAQTWAYSTLTVRLEEIELLVEGELRFGKQYFAIETADNHYKIPSRFFDNKEQFQAFGDSLRTALSHFPTGAKTLEKSREHTARWDRIRQTPTPATTALFTVIAAMFALQVIEAGGLSDMPYELTLDLGAYWPRAVWMGQWDRIVTGNFLHNGLYHIGLNTFLLVIIGRYIERYLGWQTFLVIALVSALTGTATVGLLQEPGRIMIGFSTSCFGLIGVFGYLIYYYQDELVLHHRGIPGFLVPGAILVDLIFSVVVEHYSFAGHIGGLVGGVTVFAWLREGQQKLEPVRSPRLTIAAVALALFFAGALTKSLSAYFGGSTEERRIEWVKAMQMGESTGGVYVAYKITQFLDSSPQRRNLLKPLLERVDSHGGQLARMDYDFRRAHRPGQHAGICYWNDPTEREWLEMYRNSLSDRPLAAFLNDRAWECATKDTVDKGQLREARAAAHSALEAAKLLENAGALTSRILDTYAVLTYRLAYRVRAESRRDELLQTAFDREIEALWKAFEKDLESRFDYASEILRYLQYCQETKCSLALTPSDLADLAVRAREPGSGKYSCSGSTSVTVENKGDSSVRVAAIDQKVESSSKIKNIVFGCIPPDEYIVDPTVHSWSAEEAKIIFAGKVDTCEHSRLESRTITDEVASYPD